MQAFSWSSRLVGAMFLVASAWAQPGTPATSVVGFPGAGVVQAGDLWESFLPQAFTPNYTEAVWARTLGTRTLFRMGNFDRSWTTPGTHWPGAYPITPYWFKNAMAVVYDPDSTFNPRILPGSLELNPSFFLGSQNTMGPYSEFAQLTYKTSLNGTGNPARRYSVEPYWVDGARRQHVVYEAAWPTNLGVDVKVRAHGFQGPNWNHLNDFVIVEIELKNTGFLDMDMNGFAERIDYDIKALAFQISAEAYMSISSYGTGMRVNDIVLAPARQACWIDDPDETGAPWAFTFYRAAPTTFNPTAGNWDHGFNRGSSKVYTDIYTGWVMIDAKVGGLPDDPSRSTADHPSKNTIFGTHPVGVGAQRGWFVSGQSSHFSGLLDDPRKMFYTSTAAFYVNCGRSFASTDFAQYDLRPNPALFSGGTFGDPLSFTMKPQGVWTRPNGSLQSTGTFDHVSTEDGREDSTALYPTGFGMFSMGASHTENFDGNSCSGIGPFSLKKDSVMTLVFATVAGYRLEGIQKAVRAARWTYQQDFNVPSLPPLPDMLVADLGGGIISVEWENGAETDPNLAGYKIWRASNTDTLTFLDEGMRVVDRYQEQMEPGLRPASVQKPVNPKFDAHAKVLTGIPKGRYASDTWGTWSLVQTIPKESLGSVAHGTTTGYQYRWIDSGLVYGASYWYYVSAYARGSFTGPGGDTTSAIETHHVNRNGATGLWSGTYPFAPLNANYPGDPAGKKAIGAAIVPAVPASVSLTGELPGTFVLEQNSPNPFNPATTIAFTVPYRDQVRIEVFDILGRSVATLLNETKDAGTYGMTFEAMDLVTGVYVYRLTSPGVSIAKKMLLVK